MPWSTFSVTGGVDKIECWVIVATDNPDIAIAHVAQGMDATYIVAACNRYPLLLGEARNFLSLLDPSGKDYLRLSNMLRSIEEL